MARFGSLPVEIPEKVEVKVDDGSIVVKGPKGEAVKKLPYNLSISVKDSELVVERKGESKQAKSIQGTYRAHIANMVKGVTDGWEKSLEMVGAGYRSKLTGRDLELTVGYSHPVVVKAPEGIDFSVEKSVIKVVGIDKELVGLMAAKIRDVRKPEPYKGKGIKYTDEIIRRKAGKQAGKTEGA